MLYLIVQYGCIPHSIISIIIGKRDDSNIMYNNSRLFFVKHVIIMFISVIVKIMNWLAHLGEPAYTRCRRLYLFSCCHYVTLLVYQRTEMPDV